MDKDFDFVRDKNPTAIYHADATVGLPDYVKEATVLSEDDLRGLADIAFADPLKRLHPVHTKAAAYLSAVYLGEGDSFAHKDAKKACGAWGVWEDAEKAINALPVKEAAAPPERKFAVQVDWGDGNVGRYYPIDDEFAVEKSARALDQDFFAGKMPSDVFRAGAGNIMAATREMKMPANVIPHTVKEAGTNRLHSPENGELGVSERRNLGVPEDGLEVYKAAAEMAKEAGTREACLEASSVWRDLDMLHGVRHGGRRGARDPESYFFGGPTDDELDKAASEHVIVKDVLVPVDAFKALAEDDFKHLRREFSEKTASEVIEAVKVAAATDYLGYEGGPFLLHNVARASENIANLEDWQQETLLRTLVDVA